MKLKRIWLALQSQKNKSGFSPFVLRILPFALSLLFLSACATSPKMDWDEFMKEMATERNADGDTGIPVGPDKPAYA